MCKKTIYFFSIFRGPRSASLGYIPKNQAKGDQKFKNQKFLIKSSRFKISSDSHENWYQKVFKVADFEFDVKNPKVKMADLIWRQNDGIIINSRQIRY